MPAFKTNHLFIGFAFVITALSLSPKHTQASDETLDRIAATNTFVVGYRDEMPPFSYRSPEGEIEGYSIDLCKGVHTALKQELGKPDLKIEFVEVTAESRFDLILNKKIDIVCGTTSWTLGRQAKMGFSLQTFITGAEMLVKDDSRIRSLKSLSEKKAGVIQGTLTADTIKKRIERDKIDINLITYQHPHEALNALESGEIEAYIADRVLLIGLLDEANAPNDLKLVNRFYTFDPYALMFARQSLDFKLLVDRYLAGIYRSEKAVALFDKWFSHMGVRSNENILRAMYKLQGIPE
ncbi:amino acid ABC transporter substrate-binding protein [Kiloniella sp.]|uniref:amino acid ABC transporter substrate-binding protein n=1 Tax=Kiloniella sp. TaxID=1938587 RepID=UPI003B01CF11